VQLGNILQQWGTASITPSGTTVTFPKPYSITPAVVVCPFYATPTATNVTITSTAGTQAVSWQAMGS
jgi:hypothetical protein